MARDLTAGLIAEVDAQDLRPLFLAKAEFDSGDIRLWSGYGDLVFNSETYLGAGNMLTLDTVTETQALEANGIKLKFSGIPSSLIALALTEDYQGRKISVWFGVLNSSGVLIADPYLLFKGRMDIMTTEENREDCAIYVTAESDLIALRDSKERRYTDEDQKSEYPNDRGLEFVVSSQDVELPWGVGV